MPTPYNINPKTFGQNGFGLSPCQDVYTVKLAANTEATVTVPGGLPMGALGAIGAPIPFPTTPGNTAQGRNKVIAIFHYGLETPADIWVAYNATAVVPAGSSLAKASSELFPLAWEVFAGDVIHVISATAGAEMSVSFYPIAT